MGQLTLLIQYHITMVPLIFCLFSVPIDPNWSQIFGAGTRQRNSPPRAVLTKQGASQGNAETGRAGDKSYDQLLAIAMSSGNNGY